MCLCVCMCVREREIGFIFTIKSVIVPNSVKHFFFRMLTIGGQLCKDHDVFKISIYYFYG